MIPMAVMDEGLGSNAPDGKNCRSNAKAGAPQAAAVKSSDGEELGAQPSSDKTESDDGSNSNNNSNSNSNSNSGEQPQQQR